MPVEDMSFPKKIMQNLTKFDLKALEKKELEEETHEL